MSRKQFIRSNGATCDNWIWSWSFKDEANKIIIFGQWDRLPGHEDTPPLFSVDWQTNSVGQRQAGYRQSREHIRLIEEEGYKLKTFPMIFSDDNHDSSGNGPARIAKFKPELTEKRLVRDGIIWYASTEDQPYSSLHHGYEDAGPITDEDEAIYDKIWDSPEIAASIERNKERQAEMLANAAKRRWPKGGAGG